MPTFNTTDPKPGFVYNTDDDTWYPLLGIASQSLDSLTDVIITSPSTSQILVYNGANWINGGETGDISAVTSGTGITVTNGTGPIPTIAIDTATTVDLSTAQTLTNKTITGIVYTQTLLTPSFTSNAYTLVLGDQGDILLASNSTTAGTINIPTNGSVAFPIGTQITIIQTGSGQLTIQATTPGTTTIASTGATSTAPKLRAINSSATCIKTGTDTWYVVGDIA
jgi:hypothetical protein